LGGLWRGKTLYTYWSLPSTTPSTKYCQKTQKENCQKEKQISKDAKKLEAGKGLSFRRIEEFPALELEPSPKERGGSSRTHETPHPYFRRKKGKRSTNTTRQNYQISAAA